MKNLFRFAMAVAVLFTASCAKEDISSSIGGGEVEVTFTANLADLGTRAIGDGTTVNQVYLAVYEANGNKPLEVIDPSKPNLVQGKKATIRVALLKDKYYDLVFWAQSSEAANYYTPNWEGRTLTVKYTDPDAVAQDENRDAFFLVKNGFRAGHDETVFELRRPFAQLNVGLSAEDVENIGKNGVKVNKLQAEVTVNKVFSTLKLTADSVDADGKQVIEADDATTATFTMAAKPSEKLKVSGVEYEYLSMNYLLANQNVEVNYTFSDGTTDYFRNYFAVPLKYNYRTNIIGNILSAEYDFNVIIVPGFNEPDEEVAVWDGSISKPSVNANGEYEIAEPSELAWLAAAVNGTLPANTRTEETLPADSFAGKTFILTDNINLGGQEWTPIGTSANPFKGTFDGKDKTIYDLMVNGGKDSNVGLFGYTTDGEIKNLTIQNAKVSGRLNVAVVAGTPYTSKYTNITVKGHVEVNGMAYVGAVGGKNAYANWENITVDADKTSYVKANSVENGTAYRTYVGGVCGFNGEGGHSFKNITSNINVEGSTCDVGGLFGIAHYGNKFENCVCTGNVTITNASEAAEAEEIGGIAGVWHNGGSDVVMTNCTFTGSLSANVEFTPWYGGLVGKPYSASGTGKLILNGLTMTSNGVGEKEEETNVYYVTSAEGLKWVEAQEDKFFAGKTIKLANDIDMTGVTIEKPIHFWSGRTTFDGQNYTISNLTMSTTSTEKKPFGLFGGTADIKNVKFDNANISGYSYVAVVAGNLYGNIENCHVANSTVTCTYWMAGALSGQYNAGNVTNCSVKNTTVTGPAAVAALIGNINETAGERKVENCVVEDCTIAQNSSFGGDYDKMFATAVGLINIENSKVYFNNVTVANTTVKGLASILLFGSKDDTTTVYVDGKIYVLAETSTALMTAIKEENAVVYLEPKADGSQYLLEGKLSIGKGAKLIGAGSEPVKVFNNWGSNAFAYQAHFTNTHIENISFTNNLVIDAGIANGNVTFKNCVFGGNLAHQGVHLDSGNGVVVFDNCTFVGRNMFGASLEKVIFNNCTFLNKKSSLTGADKWTGVNMWGKYEFNNCIFDTEATCNVKCDGVEATFSGCKYVDNRDIATLVNNSGFTANISFK